MQLHSSDIKTKGLFHCTFKLKRYLKVGLHLAGKLTILAKWAKSFEMGTFFSLEQKKANLFAEKVSTAQ